MMNHDSSSRSRRFCAVLLPFLFGVIPGSPLAAQGPGVEGAAWTYLGGDAWHTRYTPATQIDASSFEDLEIAWRWDASSFGPSTARATPSYVDGKLITVTGRKPACHRPRPRHRKTPLELHRTDDVAARVLDAEGIRKGRRVRRGRWTRRRVHHQSRVLPLRARRGDGRTAGQLGGGGAAAGIPLLGDRGHGGGPHRRVGAVGEPEPGIRPGSGDAARDRLHHGLLTADRRQRRGGDRELRAAGLQPDAEGDGPGRHPRLRRAHG